MSGTRSRLGAGWRRLLTMLLMVTMAAVLVGAAAIEHVEAGSKKAASKAKKSKAAEPETEAVAEGPAMPAAPGPNGERTTLRAGGLEVSIHLSTPGARLAAGSSAFAEVKIRRTKGSRAKEAALLLSSEGGSVSVVEAKGLTKKDTPDGLSLKVELDRSGTREVLVEMKLAGGKVGAAGASGATPTRSALAVTLVPSGGEASDSTRLSWELANCAGDYHAALSGLMKDRETLLTGSVKGAAAPDEALTGKWLFPPKGLGKTTTATRKRSGRKTAARKVCRRYATSIDAFTGDSIKRCIGWRIVRPAAGPADDAEVEETASITPAAVVPGFEITSADKGVYSLASDLVRSRTAAASFARKGKLEWISNRILTDLRLYFKQEPHPALCSGTDIMLEYMTGNAKQLRLGISEMAERRKSARGLAERSLAELWRVTTEASARRRGPAWAVAKPAFASPAGSSLTEMVHQIARQLLGSDRARPVLAQVSTMPALQVFRDAVDTGALDAMPESERTAVWRALSSIEAAFYVEATADRYARIDDAIFGSIEMVRKAHAKSCVCAE